MILDEDTWKLISLISSQGIRNLLASIEQPPPQGKPGDGLGWTADGTIGWVATGQVEEGPNYDIRYFRRPKCECGSEKAGIPGHSTWCAKHEGKG